MSDHHDCPGLLECDNHPRWNIIRHVEPDDTTWFVYSPGWYWTAECVEFPTHAAAITYATKQAQKGLTP